jgi:hypothetical protein
LRAGYLTALAARTLGVTPMLRPATPSRFEPESLQSGLHDVFGVQEAEPNPPAAPLPVSARRGEQPANAVTEAGRPRRGVFESDVPGDRLAAVGPRDQWAAPDASELAGPAGDAAERRRAVRAEPLADAAEPWPASGPGPGQAAPGPAARDDQPPRWADDLVTMAASPLAAPANGAPWHVDAIRAGRSRQQGQPGDGTSEPAEGSGTGPAIIVRIGRVDVRAVQAAPPPAPAPRSRPPSGPSLEEYLLARDRRRR